MSRAQDNGNSKGTGRFVLALLTAVTIRMPKEDLRFGFYCSMTDYRI